MKDELLDMVFEMVFATLPSDVKLKLGAERARAMFKVAAGFIMRSNDREDTIWDRDARKFTESLLLSGSASSNAEYIATIGAKVADALAWERKQRRDARQAEQDAELDAAVAGTAH